MKKFKTVLTAIAMLLVTSTFASGPVKITPEVKSAFENDFPKAGLVNWKETDGFYFASFLLNDKNVDAAYTGDGQLVGTSRRISLSQMPLGILLAIEGQYAGYEVEKSAIELTYEGLTRYYVHVENEHEQVKLKCLSDGDLWVEQKTKK